MLEGHGREEDEERHLRPAREEPGRRHPRVDRGDQDAAADEAGDETPQKEKRGCHEEVREVGEGLVHEVHRRREVERGHREEHEDGQDEPREREGEDPRGSGANAALLQHRADAGPLGEVVEREPLERETHADADGHRGQDPDREEGQHGEQVRDENLKAHADLRERRSDDLVEDFLHGNLLTTSARAGTPSRERTRRPGSGSRPRPPRPRCPCSA